MKRYIISAIQNVADLSFEEQLDLAQDSRTSEEVIYELYANPDCKNIIHAIAANPSTPTEILSDIANSSDLTLHKSLTFNPNLSKSILDILANDDDFGIKCKVAGHSNTSAKTLRKLVAHTDSYYLLHEIVSNPNATKNIIFTALKKDSAVIDAILGNPTISDEFLQELVSCSATSIRRSLAKTTQDPNILTRLASDPHYHVRLAVAENWNTPMEIVKQLKSDPEWLVCHGATDAYQLRCQVGKS